MPSMRRKFASADLRHRNAHESQPTGAAASARSATAPNRAGETLTEAHVPATAHKHRVVIIGAGFGGLAAAKKLKDAPVEVVIVDARNHHTFQPLLYQVATAGLDAENVCFPVRGIVRSQRNARVLMENVSDVDLANRILLTSSGQTIGYDHLIVACGAVTNTFNIPGVQEFGFGLKSLGDALAVRTHVLEQFEHADSRPDADAQSALTVVIAGGGPTGVELAGAMAELFHKVLSRDFPDLDVHRSRVVLVEAGPRLLPSFKESLSANAKRALEAQGVEVLLNTAVASATAESVELVGGGSIPTQTLVWAAGVRPHPLAAALGELGPGGRVIVEADGSLPDHPEVFVVGDMAAARGDGGSGDLLPQVAPVAMQAAEHAAAMISDDVDGGMLRFDRTAFEYHDKGSMATIGRNAAVAQLPNGMTFSGPLGWLAWLVLHLVMLIGFRNRANVLVNWAWNYVTYDRGSRVIATLPMAPPPVRSGADQASTSTGQGAERRPADC